MGSSSPKRFFATVAPNTTTLAPIFASLSRKSLPSASRHSRMSKIDGVLPVMSVDQFMLPYTSWDLL